MCGIAGVLTTNNQIDLTGTINTMVDAIPHRGPDAHGNWVDEQQGIALGHTRLSILDLSESGAQPMVSLSGRYIVSFNGEIYNFLEIKKELSSFGYQFKGHSDTEVLLTAIQHYGIKEGVTKLHGMFAIALWDRELSELTLIRDRVGEKPLYYGQSGNTIFFGSELKCFFDLPFFTKSIDQKVVGLYLKYKYIPSPYTIFESVNKLEPGCYLTIQRGQAISSVESKKYWDPQNFLENSLCDLGVSPSTSYIDVVENELTNVIGRQMVSDVPLGAFLSGGIDSSLVVALMQKQTKEKIKTFTIGFDEKNFNEAIYAKKVAQHLGTDHHELYLRPNEIGEAITKMPDIYDEPFSDVSQVPTYLVSKFAKEFVTVVLSGDGGDELFYGYGRYNQFINRWKKFGQSPIYYPFGILERGAGFSSLLEKLAINSRGGAFVSGIRSLLGFSSIMSSKNASLAYSASLSAWKEPTNLVRSGNKSTKNFAHFNNINSAFDLERLIPFLDFTNYLPDDILVKVDRAAMANSLETRVPMLDHKFVELAFGLPFSEKWDGQKGKIILKTILGKYVPHSLFERPKMGFGVPIGTWLKGELKEWTMDYLNVSSINKVGVFKPKQTLNLLNQHLDGRADWGEHLWGLVMFQAWADTNL